MSNYSNQSQQQEQISTPYTKNITIQSSEPTGGIGIGPIKIEYGDLRLDLIAACGILVLVTIGYIIKKKIDKKYEATRKLKK